MLANPVVLPAWASPEIWIVAMVAMWAEISTEVAMLRRLTSVIGLMEWLLGLNILTWLGFLIAIDRVDQAGEALGWALVALEAAVVVAESLLIWAALTICSRARQCSTLGLLRVAWVALVGNLVSIAISIAPVVALGLLR